MGTVRCNIDQNNSFLEFEVDGAVDEDIVLPTISFEGVKKAYFDFEKMTFINSCGIRDWISWFKAVPESVTVIYKNCPVSLIDQVNMVEGLLPENGKVKSFKIPYYCEECDNISTELVNLTDDSGTNFEAEEYIKCGKCSSKAEIDVIESKYFKFLKR